MRKLPETAPLRGCMQIERPSRTMEAMEERPRVSNITDTRNEVCTYIYHNNTQIYIKLDTGAQVNVIPESLYNKLDNPPALRKPTMVLMAYNQQTIPIRGIITLICTHNHKEYDINFYVSSTSGLAILGLNDCRRLNHITIDCENIKIREPSIYEVTIYDQPLSLKSLQTSYPNLFKGIGTFPNRLHIEVKSNIHPVIHAARRVPLNIQKEVAEELHRMELQEVITRIREPTPWVSSITYARKKSGQIRIYLDPKDLNKAICRPHYQARTLDDISHLLCHAKIFTKLDARSGYWAVKLDHESSILTTFNTHIGRYRFLRLPFGLNLSQDVFQEHMDTMLQELNGAMLIADDIIVFGSNLAIHDENLIALMERSAKYGIVYNPEKCNIARNSISFFGLTYTEGTVRPDSNRTIAISNTQPPKNVKELRSFLGVATYMSPFIPNMTNLLTPIRELTHAENTFQWTPSHQTSFENIKKAICMDTSRE